MLELPFFLPLNEIPLYVCMYLSLLIPSVVDEHLGHFLLLATVKSAMTNIDVQTSL